VRCRPAFFAITVAARWCRDAEVIYRENNGVQRLCACGLAGTTMRRHQNQNDQAPALYVIAPVQQAVRVVRQMAGLMHVRDKAG